MSRALAQRRTATETSLVSGTSPLDKKRADAGHVLGMDVPDRRVGQGGMAQRHLEAGKPVGMGRADKRRPQPLGLRDRAFSGESLVMAQMHRPACEL